MIGISLFQQESAKRSGVFHVRVSLRNGITGGHFAHFSCAGTLLVAAASKLYQLFTDPALGVLYGSRWTQTAVVGYETLLSLWLVSGIAVHSARRIALVTFVVFGCVTLYLGFSGEESCGCFGRLSVNPWWTFVLDAALVLVLAATMLRRNGAGVRADSMSDRRPRPLARVAVATGAALAGIFLLTAALWRPGAPISSPDRIADSRFVLLEPEQWVDRPFPLTDYIDWGEQSRPLRGSWVLMFYRHGCPRCHRLLPEYERLAEGLRRSRAGVEVALIEVPPFGQVTGTGTSPAGQGVTPNSPGQESRPGPLSAGRLSRSKNWFIRTPCEVRVTDGRVTAVTFDEDSLPTVAVRPVQTREAESQDP